MIDAIGRSTGPILRLWCGCFIDRHFPVPSMVPSRAKPVGVALREARRALGLTLRGVEARSRGRFKPSAVGGYERGEREISLHRFCELALLYGIPPATLLENALRDPARTEGAIVVAGLDLVPEGMVFSGPDPTWPSPKLRVHSPREIPESAEDPGGGGRSRAHVPLDGPGRH